MNIFLKPELERFVSAKIRTGQYNDANDLVNEAIEVLMEQDQFTPEHEAYLKREIRRGRAQLDAEEFSDLDATKIIAQERQKLSDEPDSR